MVFQSLAAGDVDAKSPLDDTLMQQIKDNFDDLDSRVVAAGVAPLLLELVGRLTFMSTWKRSLCGALINKQFTPTIARYALKKSGTSGTLDWDLRVHAEPKSPITSIASQFSASTSSIGRAGSGLSTQSVARSTAQLSTQSITHAEAGININSIVNVGGNTWQYNLASALSANNFVGDQIVVASATTGGNNGTFVIQEIGRSGGNNFTVSNASGAVQLGAAGAVQPKIMSYNFTNPVSTQFASGEDATFASHTSANNDGTLSIFKVNQSGNNIWTKNSAGVVQAGVAGTADTNRWTYTFTGAASATDYVVGEYAHMTGHTSGDNDGDFPITQVNLGGNNVIVWNSIGVAQGGAAGTTNTNRWVYTLPTDPSTSSAVVAGDTIRAASHSTGGNNGTFTVKEVNRASGLNIVVANTSGAVQGGAAGTISTTKKVVSFASDLSAVYTTSSYVEMQGCPDLTYNYNYTRAPYRVLAVNRGGGSNYNIVLDVPTGAEQPSPAGYVQTEMKSIFSVAQSIACDLSGNEPNQNLSGSTTNLNGVVIPANTPVMLYISSYMSGDPTDLSVSIF